jgi:hypothetical protein
MSVVIGRDIATARIHTRPDGLYELADGGDGDMVVMIPVYDSNHELADLCVWDPAAPGRWWLRYGDVAVLGGHALAVEAYHGGAIRLHATPQEWLLGQRRGVCVLLWAAPLDYLFEGVGTVDCDSPELHQRFMKALRRWEPRVVVRRRARHAV